jgi:hypothetical protein
MGRRLPRAFFWIDQSLIRGGVWLKLSAEARLAYIALSASCDRQGVSIWSRSKLMELSACKDPEDWRGRLVELESYRLIEPLPEHSPPAILLVELDPELSRSAGGDRAASNQMSATWAGGAPTAPIVVHTQTTIHLGGKSTHAEPGSSD